MSTTMTESPQQVSLDQLRGNFDDDAIKLVELYHLADWSTRLSTRGHVIAHSPDGTMSASITRDSLRGRSGRNAAAPLKQWTRLQLQKSEDKLRDTLTKAHENRTKGAAFGITDMAGAKRGPEDMELTDLPPRIKAQIDKDSRLKEHIARLRAAGIDLRHRLAFVTARENPNDSWYVADQGEQTIIAHAEAMTIDEAYALARADEVLQPLPAPTTEPEDGEAEMVQKIKCDDCGELFDRGGEMALHQRRTHTGFVCDICGQNVGKGSRSLSAHRKNVHGQTTFGAEAKKVERRKARREELTAEGFPTKACMWCGVLFPTTQGRAGHERNTHVRLGETYPRLAPEVQRAVPGDVTVTSPDVTPAPDTEEVPVTSPGSPDPGLVARVLEALPGGDEAVDMVAKIRAVVTPPLVAELARVTAERDRLLHDNEILTKANEDLSARMDILREAMNV